MFAIETTDFSLFETSLFSLLCRYCSENRLQRFLFNISFASPFLLVLLWVKPVSRDYLTDRIFHGMAAPLMTEHAFETMRLLLIVAAVLLRLAVMPTYLQAYLNMAYHRIEEQKKEAGRITNTELQKKVCVSRDKKFVVSCLPTCSFLVLSSDVGLWPYYSYAVVHFADLFITGPPVIREESLIHWGVCNSTHFSLHYWSVWKHLCFYPPVSLYIALVLFVHNSHTSLSK